MAGNLSMLWHIFRFQVVSWGKKKKKKLIWGKGKGIYILDSNLDIGTIHWEDLRTRLRLTGGPGEREMILLNING